MFEAPGKAAEVQKAIEQAIVKRFGFDVDVVIRTIAQIKKAIKDDPFTKVATDDSMYLICFLSGKPNAAAAKELESTDFAPEQLAIKGTELYAWCPNKINDSPMLKTVNKSKVADHMTARNLRTLKKIAESSL